MKSSNQYCFAILVLFLVSTQILAQGSGTISTGYDHGKNITTVKVVPVKISGDKDKYHRLYISPAFSYPGHQPKLPEIIDFELLTVVKGKLRVDLYVVFVVDGETIFLSSNRSGIKRPVPGRRWMGERLVFRMPYNTLQKMAAAKSVAVKLDAVRFEFGDEPMQVIRDFAKHIQAVSR
ncbi:MAG TPA: hypothetical protein VJU84_17715 [Pyrinomonadaceae bacterium]|nr:hypothetical protein [Pyrinomonadaceae bacterium]